MYSQFLKSFTMGLLLLANTIPLVYADFYVIPIEKLNAFHRHLRLITGQLQLGFMVQQLRRMSISTVVL